VYHHGGVSVGETILSIRAAHLGARIVSGGWRSNLANRFLSRHRRLAGVRFAGERVSAFVTFCARATGNSDK